MKPAEFGDLMMCNTHLATVDAMLKGLPSSGLDLQNILKMINFEWKIMETIYIYTHTIYKIFQPLVGQILAGPMFMGGRLYLTKRSI